MQQESVIALIRDLTSRLSAVATEFGDRAERAVIAETGTAPGSPTGLSFGQAGDVDATRRATAERLIAERRARRAYFAPELFHEPAWDMLLSLFLANDEARILNVKALVASSDAPVTTSQRWIDHLHKLRLIDRIGDPDDRRRVEISLSDTGLTAIERYLDAIAAA
ncbi:hypothetical protein [Sphingomonas bacterium]|uniref:hypothetical protein n=1 Tax=Sphingomonas bacterium TaxID=1895847 RepID=UPI001575B8F0|nr:hypothetical protein [Sphingomonas bacterium]